MSCLEQGTLPFRWDRIGIRSGIGENTIRPLESPLCDKVTVQEHVERLHNLLDNQLLLQAIGQILAMLGHELTIVKHMVKAQRHAQG